MEWENCTRDTRCYSHDPTNTNAYPCHLIPLPPHTHAQEKLEQEEQNTRINLQKLNAQWRTIMRHGQKSLTPYARITPSPPPSPNTSTTSSFVLPPNHTAKATELRKEIEILSQSFDRVLDRKESVMQSCLRDLTEAEAQVQGSWFGSFCSIILRSTVRLCLNPTFSYPHPC